MESLEFSFLQIVLELLEGTVYTHGINMYENVLHLSRKHHTQDEIRLHNARTSQSVNPYIHIQRPRDEDREK